MEDTEQSAVDAVQAWLDADSRRREAMELLRRFTGATGQLAKWTGNVVLRRHAGVKWQYDGDLDALLLDSEDSYVPVSVMADLRSPFTVAGGLTLAWYDDAGEKATLHVLDSGMRLPDAT